ncbi:AraC family transcriptional regulator of adaptative response/methylated-DNA-[protein]-cysteine methyltransferase [Geothermobacter ehrlichii]|uniref:methylated-DNA--[protein]-cysteine S-methyltransferase n=1 Tax=Geothermobacter ehrlichii TaxID=213224 RepID=A0A5D3WKC3_9BACT|nr:methylated-DNA--[protein]-cysteine S-methyltransferase [Geothermobacter ehrlichii]TYO99061.1 AraC family transcriptional regulator of adaptative response/methylated-DNA-[protein]-cysteine methyltransferase [Geothermobacter ehrlichii]
MDHPDYRRIEQAIHFLEEHATDQPSLEEVAAHIGLSPYHFQRLFKAWAGVSPKRFLQHLTVESAKRLLRDSASVLEAALDVGLSGPGRLHDLFVSVEAMTPGEYKSWGRELNLQYGYHPTPFGECLIAVTGRGICSLAFVDRETRDRALEELRHNWREASLVENPRTSEDIVGQIFAPAQKRGQKPLKVLLKGTNFQLKVWQALLKIPEGAVVTYGALADAVGHRGAHRAVGTAVGHNPIAYLIPCHRVLRSNGGIGGYRWGTTRKRAILAREAALVDKNEKTSDSRTRESFPSMP